MKTVSVHATNISCDPSSYAFEAHLNIEHIVHVSPHIFVDNETGCRIKMTDGYYYYQRESLERFMQRLGGAK